DWAEMLMRMYTRWAEKHGHKVDVYDISYAEEAGIKSATFVVQGEYLFGTISVEKGDHRLVRLYTFDHPQLTTPSLATLDIQSVVPAQIPAANLSQHTTP